MTFGAYTGLRAGEQYGLKVKNVDLRSGRVTVVDNLTEVAGVLHFGTPTKTGKTRSVAMPEFLTERVARHIDGLDRDDLVFAAAGGGPMRHTNYWTVHFKPAVVPQPDCPRRCGCTMSAIPAPRGSSNWACTPKAS
ncbi:MAG: hypothetical protein NVS3B21_33320 [Acidimicrobiales bacterium]